MGILKEVFSESLDKNDAHIDILLQKKPGINSKINHILNVFCSTGEGGGVDPTCSLGGGEPDRSRNAFSDDVVKDEKRLAEGVLDHLTPEHREAIRSYTSYSYRNLNERLRTRKKLSVWDQNLSDSLSNAIETAGKPIDVPVYRGLKFSEKRQANMFLAKCKVGKTVKMLAFQSTSLAPNVGSDIAAKSEHGIVVELHVKKALPLGGSSSFSTEREVLIDKGKTFRVAKVSVESYGKRSGRGLKLTTVKLEML
jgi:hypothetical protein